MSASTTEQRSSVEQMRTICCVCGGVIHEGSSPDGLVSHGVHPGECARRMRAGEVA